MRAFRVTVFIAFLALWALPGCNEEPDFPSAPVGGEL